jgi:hypothetical protein
MKEWIKDINVRLESTSGKSGEYIRTYGHRQYFLINSNSTAIKRKY